MKQDDLYHQLQEAFANHRKELEAYRLWYLPEGLRNEDGFEVLQGLPEGVRWVLEPEVLMMEGEKQGLQQLTYIIKAFAQDAETVGLFYQDFLLLKDTEPHAFEGLTVIAMPDEAWSVWGGKMVDVAWENDFPELTFNELGFFVETLPLDIGIRLLGGAGLNG